MVADGIYARANFFEGVEAVAGGCCSGGTPALPRPETAVFRSLLSTLAELAVVVTQARRRAR